MYDKKWKSLQILLKNPLNDNIIQNVKKLH